MNKENQIILYQDNNDITRVSVRFADEDLWLTQGQLVEIYQTSKSNVSEHIKHIFEDGELAKEATVRKFRTVQIEGSRKVEREVEHYNLDMIIALGYRVQSQVATRFRRWATQRLHEYIQKGFAMDDERLKQGGNRYFRELLQRIRDIRSSERNFYQQVTDIYATATDYDPRDEMTKMFFATVQNKLHYAAHGHTAAEVIYERADAEQPFMGLKTFEGELPAIKDIKIAKNYLDKNELKILNNLVSGYFDFAEIMALEHRPVYMMDYVKQLDTILQSTGRPLLKGSGSISHQEAMDKALAEYRKYQVKTLTKVEEDYLDSINALGKIAKRKRRQNGEQ